MRLPIPIFYSDMIYTDIEIESPRAGVLADVRKVADNGCWFSAIHVLISGCVVQLSGSEDVVEKSRIKAICKHMPYRSAEYIGLKCILQISPDDGFEGVYTCPRCGNQTITEYIKQEDEVIDTRDFVSDLEVIYYDGEENDIYISLNDPVTIKSKGEIIIEIASFNLHFPTLNECMIAELRYGHDNMTRTQFGIYVEALEMVNGSATDAKWKNNFGMLLFENMKEFVKLNKTMSEYGMKSVIEKRCIKCGKLWNAEVNTTNFFESALRSM
jgi:hypothetical protein